MANTIAEVDISESVKANTLRYSKETFIRAFADWRDGLKPVHRRILWTLFKNNVVTNTKVATLVGSTLAFHPHGDSAVYGALVRLGQDWVMNYPYVDGSGNFGTQAGDVSAAGRYIEARLSSFAKKIILEDLDEVSVNYIDNYDYKSKLPEYLPSKVPLVLVNGINGIGVAFSSNIPPHNLNEVVDRCITYIKNPSISNAELCKDFYPDFPTGGEILNGKEVSDFYTKGTPCVCSIRGKAQFIPEKNMIILTEFPYGVAIDEIEKQVKDEVKNGNMILSGIESIIDNNNNDDDEVSFKKKKGATTFEYTCKKEANMVEILNEISKRTKFKTSVPLNFMTTKDGFPRTVTVKDIIADWYFIRKDVIRRKRQNNISKLQDKKYLYEALLIVYDKTDDVLKVIRDHKGEQEELISKLCAKYGLVKVQAKSISDYPLGKLASYGKNELVERLTKINEEIKENQKILNDIPGYIIDDLLKVKEEFGRPRRTTVHQDFQLKASERPVITKGSFIFSHCELGLYDVNGCRDSKSILTGLRPYKGFGKAVKEIVGGTPLKGTPKGFVVCYSDATINLIDTSVFKILNVWYDTKCDEKDVARYITAACPYYEDTDEVICLSDDFKIKRIEVSQLNKRAVASGSVITSIARRGVNDPDTLDYLLVGVSSPKGPTYSVSPIEDIPLLGRSASGVKTGYNSGDAPKVLLLPISYDDGSDDIRIMIGSFDQSGQSYIHSIPVNAFKIGNRVNKPKTLALPKDQIVTGIEEMSIDGKDDVLCMISKNGSSTLNLRSNFKKPFSFKRIFQQVIAQVKL